MNKAFPKIQIFLLCYLVANIEAFAAIISQRIIGLDATEHIGELANTKLVSNPLVGSTGSSIFDWSEDISKRIDRIEGFLKEFGYLPEKQYPVQ